MEILCSTLCPHVPHCLCRFEIKSTVELTLKYRVIYTQLVTGGTEIPSLYTAQSKNKVEGSATILLRLGLCFSVLARCGVRRALLLVWQS